MKNKDYIVSLYKRYIFLNVNVEIVYDEKSTIYFIVQKT